MSAVPVHINGREYLLACDPGQEELLVALSQEVDDRVLQLSRQIPQAGEAMLLLLSALMLADELSDAKRENRELRGEINHLRALAEEDRAEESELRAREIETSCARLLEQAANRIESLAGELETRYIR